MTKEEEILKAAEEEFFANSFDAALIIFDKLNENRRLPFLLSDISRTHPEFLLRYKGTVDTICKDSIEMHSKRLEQCISNGKASQCTMTDIYNTVLALVTAPFLNLPLLQNVAGFTPEQTDRYLFERRAEIAKVLEARYSAGR